MTKKKDRQAQFLESWTDSHDSPPPQPGEYNVTVFHPEYHAKMLHVPRRAVEKLRRFWNGNHFSVGYRATDPVPKREEAKKIPSTLQGEHARYWWRPCN